jgi:hypothetical protein
MCKLTHHRHLQKLIVASLRNDKVFENGVLRRIFGPKRDEVMGGWRKLHNEELHNLYTSPSVIRTFKSMRMRWAEYITQIGEKRNAYIILVGKPEGKRPLRR